MRIESRRQGSRATVYLNGASDEATGIALFSELTRLLEAGVTTIVVDTRGAVTVHPSVRAVTSRFHRLLSRLDGGLTVEPPSGASVLLAIPGQRPARPPRLVGPSRWFG